MAEISRYFRIKVTNAHFQSLKNRSSSGTHTTNSVKFTLTRLWTEERTAGRWTKWIEMHHHVSYRFQMIENKLWLIFHFTNKQRREQANTYTTHYRCCLSMKMFNAYLFMCYDGSNYYFYMCFSLAACGQSQVNVINDVYTSTNLFIFLFIQTFKQNSKIIFDSFFLFLSRDYFFIFFRFVLRTSYVHVLW